MAPPKIVKVSYLVVEPVKVDGVDLAPGKYFGRQVALARTVMGQTSYGPWEYKIDPPGFGDLDCTAQVSSGKIKIQR